MGTKKLYWDTENRKLVMSLLKYKTFKNVAVICRTQEDWDYATDKLGYDLVGSEWYNYKDRTYLSVDASTDVSMYGNVDENTFGRYFIDIEQFKEFYPETPKGVKESDGKLFHELDFSFIKQMSERMSSNKGKYPPFNWKEPIDVESLTQAIFRHVLEVMEGNFEDDGREFGHLESIACNAMMLNYQLKNNGKRN